MQDSKWERFMYRCLNTFLFIAFVFTVCLWPGEYALADEESDAIRVALMNNRPLSYQGKDGKAEGVYPEVIREIAGRENWNLEFVLDSWRGSLERRLSGILAEASAAP